MKELLELKRTLRAIEELLSGRDGVCEGLVLLLKAKNIINELVKELDERQS